MNKYTDRVAEVLSHRVGLDNLVDRTIIGIHYGSEGGIIIKFKDGYWIHFQVARDLGGDLGVDTGVPDIIDLHFAKLLSDEEWGEYFRHDKAWRLNLQERRELAQLERLKIKYGE